MKKIAIVTATRAEYGLLAPVIKKLNKNPEIDVRVVATGTHLSREHGMTINEIRQDGIEPDREIEILQNDDSDTSVSKTMGVALSKFADYFAEVKPDALMVLGDRYETLAICIAAMNARIPIVHLHGGEATEGAIDEYVRNAITKLSYLHFTSTEEYRKRVIQMGEDPSRVYKSGAVGVENAMHTSLMTMSELEESLGCTLTDRFAVLTFHPVTLENNTASEQVEALIDVIKSYKDIVFLCTKANADANGSIINKALEKAAAENDNILLYDSLGMRRYLSALSYASFVIGNSSSGIIEAPSFKIPTINIGDRQKGRIQADSVINCKSDRESIREAIDIALQAETIKKMENVINPYGDGNASELIASITGRYLLEDRFEIQKKFYDIEF